MATDNGRYGGGAGGKETRYHNPAADTARRTEASVGAVVKSSDHGDVPEHVEASDINTMDGPARGTLGGTSYPCEKWQKGF